MTSGGGSLPVWGNTPGELIYQNDSRQLVSAMLRFSGKGGEVLSSKPLFVLPPFTFNFDISPDGQSFFVTRALEMQKFPPLTLVTNWESGIRLK